MKERVFVETAHTVVNADQTNAYDLAVGTELIVTIVKGALRSKLYMSAIFSSEVPEILEIRISRRPIVSDLVYMRGNIEQIDADCISITDSRKAHKTQYKPQIELLAQRIKIKLEELHYYTRGWKTQWLK